MGVAASPSVKAPSEQQWRGDVREFEQTKVNRMDHTVRDPPVNLSKMSINSYLADLLQAPSGQ